MICPRCGTLNAAERAGCTRCAGSLAPPPARPDQPLPPVRPLTRRAELMVLAQAHADGERAAGPTAGAVAAPAIAEPGLYLLASERSTGQPEPPGGLHREAEPARAEAGQRNDRFVPRLSPAP